MTGETKQAMSKAADMIGGMVGKLEASVVTGADGFVESAAIGDRYEIAAAQLAEQRAQSEAVRAFACQMIADHTTSTHHLQAALEMNETQGVSAPPSSLDERRKGMIRHLEEAPRDSFDKTYLDQQLLAHKETATLMRHFADGGDNPQLRSFAAGTLPVVERHLTEVERLRATV